MAFKSFQEFMYEEDIEVCVTRLSEVIVHAATEGYTAFLYEGKDSLQDIATGIRTLFPDCRTNIWTEGLQVLFDWTPRGKTRTIARLKNGFTHLNPIPLTPPCRNTPLTT